MSEKTESNPNQMIVIGLVVVAVLLAAIVGILIYQQSQAVPAPTAAAPVTTPDQGGQTGAPAGMGGAGQQMPSQTQQTEFDPKTATKVPAGSTPEAMVKAYLAAVVAGKFDEAYKMLPVDTQKNYGDVNAYSQQVKAYGITSGETGKPVENGDTVTVVATQVTPQMPISYTWTFKKVGDQWYAASRAMGGQ